MDGETIRSQLTSLFQTTWNQEHLPQELRDATIVHIHKRKGNHQSCDNHRGISLLSIVAKILAHVLLNHFLDRLEQGHLPESQCSFHTGRGTSDMIFDTRQLQEKCMEQHRDLYTTFFDLISLETKLKVYRAVVLTTLLYGSVTWTAYRRHEKQLNHFHFRCLCNLFHIRWPDKVLNMEVLKQATFPSITTTMRKAQLRWADHVSRMPDDRIPKADPLWRTLSRQAYSQRAEKTLEGQSEGLLKV